MNITLDKIKEVVNERSGVNVLENTSKQYIVFCRWVFFKLSVELLEKKPTYTELGDFVGKDHCTPLYALSKKNKEKSRVEKVIEENLEIRDIYNSCYYTLTKGVRINIDEIENLIDAKKAYKQEIKRLLREFENNLKDVEDNLKNQYKNLFSIREKEYLSKLFELPEHQLKDFEETRVKPYLLMNENLKNGI